MLQRQQASAIIALTAGSGAAPPRRQKIVAGAVGMVEMALADLERKKNYRPPRRRPEEAQMVGNLLWSCARKTGTPSPS